MSTSSPARRWTASAPSRAAGPPPAMRSCMGANYGRRVDPASGLTSASVAGFPQSTTGVPADAAGGGAVETQACPPRTPMRSKASASTDLLTEQTLRGLLAAGRSVVSELDLELVLERVLATAADVTGARYAALGILDERRTGLERFITHGLSAPVPGAPPAGHGVL